MCFMIKHMRGTRVERGAQERKSKSALKRALQGAGADVYICTPICVHCAGVYDSIPVVQLPWRAHGLLQVKLHLCEALQGCLILFILVVMTQYL